MKLRLLGGICMALPMAAWAAENRPNIIWIVAEDASPHISCYGETVIETRHLDALARGGQRYTRAFVTAPVCSPSRSAMVSGMFQTSSGYHNHRSQRTGGKGGGNRAYYESYKVHASRPLVPQLFKRAGYYVTNHSKTDYNFVVAGLYEKGKDWTTRKKGQPFFAQFQLKGGKNRGAKVDNPVAPEAVKLPPYYPDEPAIRKDWANYLNSWIATDREVGKILAKLEASGEADNTYVFFWTDHGVSHARGKQFLYDEGIQVPLIVRYPKKQHAGTTRDDLVLHIDVAAASLAAAGIDIPDYVQGRNFLAPDYTPRETIFAARDRCDETVDVIRCARTKKYKYIRNFLSYYPHLQSNQYKDGKKIVQTIRSLDAAGKLTPLQASLLRTPRPAEELYDLEVDPDETKNLASDPAYANKLAELRDELYAWMQRSGDLGLVPEPILEDLGKTAGNKCLIMARPENRDLVRRLINVMNAGEKADVPALTRALNSDRDSVRYWAASWLGRQGQALDKIEALLEDNCPTVRVAAALAVAQNGKLAQGLPVLEKEVFNDNLLVGLYAIRAIEDLGPAAKAAKATCVKAQKSPYEFTQRIGRRLAAKLGSRRSSSR